MNGIGSNYGIKYSICSSHHLNDIVVKGVYRSKLKVKNLKYVEENFFRNLNTKLFDPKINILKQNIEVIKLFTFNHFKKV